MKVGDIVKDKGDSFKAIEDAGVIIEVLPERYSYRTPWSLGLVKVKYDGILVRWMDKKGTTHVYPCCCVNKLELSEEAAEELKKSAEATHQPMPPQDEENAVDVAETLEGLPFDEDTDEDEEPITVAEKPSINKLQEQLKEIERIVAERNAVDDAGEQE